MALRAATRALKNHPVTNPRGLISNIPRLQSTARWYSEGERAEEPRTEVTPEANETREGWLFVDSIFPVRIGGWDFRFLFGQLREEDLLEHLSDVLSGVKTHDLRIVAIEPHQKDGGVFIKYEYLSPPGSDGKKQVDDIIRDLRSNVQKKGGVPTWLGLPRGNIWEVKGRPWREDLRRYASPLVRVSFDGPDLTEESLYNLMRPYGRLVDITAPTPVPAGSLRSSTVFFRQHLSAATARNTLHGFVMPNPSPSNPNATTRLRTSFEQPIQAHVVRDYIASHPKIFGPVFFFLIGTITYTIFDPVRVFMVEGKLNDWFDYREYGLYKWIRTNALDRFSLGVSAEHGSTSGGHGLGVWKERQEAEGSLKRYLSDIPSTIAFIHGPQGSGKSALLTALMNENHRKHIIIDVNEIAKGGTEMTVVSALATQTGYWPIFSFTNSLNNLIDVASVGLIGQKTGLSSTFTEQLKQVLDVVGTGLRHVNTTYKEQHARKLERERKAELERADMAKTREKIMEGRWHDGRLDCVAGNGVMSELGVGDERFGENDADAKPPSSYENMEYRELPDGEKGWTGESATNDSNDEVKEKNQDKRKQRSAEDLQAVESMPVVIIKNFDSKSGGGRREELMDVLAQWASSLADNQVAHVIVVSANRENFKRVAKAIPSKPLHLIALSDADNASALSFVKQKLHDVDYEIDFSQEQVTHVQRLGGRASDLESLVHKVRSGQGVEAAVEDIIVRGVSELRKNAFGDDAEDAKNLPWKREQAWVLMKQLSAKTEISYYDTLMDFPFKGDETALRNMEHAELISITTINGRPSAIRPGKPVYKYVFERLVHDPVFHATQDIAVNTKLLEAANSTVKSCEEELLSLKGVEALTMTWWGSRSAVTQRVEYLLKNMKSAEMKIDDLEKQNAKLKKILSKAA